MTAKFEVIEGGDSVRRQAAAWFARQRADDVSVEDIRAWHQWLEADARHRAAYARLEHLWSGLGAHAAHPEVAARIDPAPQETIAVSTGRRATTAPWRMRLGVAAMLVLAVLGAWWTPAPSTVQDTLYATAVGAHREIVLEDGSRISLDTDTRLRVAYRDTERSLFLEQGRAFFQVAHEHRPMRIRSAHGGVRVVGTAFELDQRTDALDITLIEGKLELLPLSDSMGDATPRPMVAGHRATLTVGHTPRIEASGTSAPPVWLSGRLVFEDATLAEALAEFNRYSLDKWRIDDPALAGIRLTGVFHSDAPQTFIGALRELHPVRVDTATPGMMRLHAGNVQAPERQR